MRIFVIPIMGISSRSATYDSIPKLKNISLRFNRKLYERSYQFQPLDIDISIPFSIQERTVGKELLYDKGFFSNACERL